VSRALPPLLNAERLRDCGTTAGELPTLLSPLILPTHATPDVIAKFPPIVETVFAPGIASSPASTDSIDMRASLFLAPMYRMHLLKPMHQHNPTAFVLMSNSANGGPTKAVVRFPKATSFQFSRISKAILKLLDNGPDILMPYFTNLLSFLLDMLHTLIALQLTVHMFSSYAKSITLLSQPTMSLSTTTYVILWTGSSSNP
jgi:hypothetical protein